jgi:hypothetical protein
MLDGRERFVEMMQQIAPCLISRGLPEADHVVFDRVPFDQQQIAMGGSGSI